MITDGDHTTNSRLCSKSVISQQRRSAAHDSLETNFLATCKIFFATQVLLCSFVSWKCFQGCRYITLEKLLFQVCVVVLHWQVNTRKFL